MSRRRITEEILDIEIDTSLWKSVDINLLSDENRIVFLNRKKAIDLYIKQVDNQHILEETRILRKELIIFLKRCLMIDKNGEMYGYTALIPYKRIKNYTREILPNSTSQGFSGAFELLIKTYPILHELIYQNLFKSNYKNGHSKITKKNYIHKAFIKKCREIGLNSTNNYPFTSLDLAQRSLYNYIKKLENEHFSLTASLNSENAGMIANKTATLADNYISNLRPFERVQFDGHILDTMMTYTFVTPDGLIKTGVLERIWILTVMDVSTRAVLGYHLCYNREYSSYDVLLTIKKSIEPQALKQLTITNLKYPEDGGLPSQIIPEAEWALWEEFYFDNAKSHLAKNVINQISDLINCSINTGPAYAPLKRSILERFFKTFEENGFHRLSSTTGSNINDTNRANPEDRAIKDRITIEEIEELVEILIANYNSSIIEANYFLSPLEAMKQKIQKNKHFIRYLPESDKDNFNFLTITTERTVKGNIQGGRRPHINYENVKYTNDILLKSKGMIGKKLKLVINSEDIRFIKAYLEDGSELGLLVAHGSWGRIKHSLKIRKEVYKLKNKKLIQFTEREDPIDIYQDYLRDKAINTKQYRNKLLDVEKSIATSSEIIPIEEELSSNKNYESDNIISLNVSNKYQTKNKPLKKFTKTIIY